MKVRPPSKFSGQWWVLISGASATSAMLAAVSLKWIGFEFDIYFILLVVLASGVSDLFLAISMEAMSPTRITVAPGEKHGRDCDLNEMAVVISGFENGIEGRVSVRGENWSARTVSAIPGKLHPGAEVAILDRDGLTLIVDGLTDDK